MGNAATVDIVGKNASLKAALKESESMAIDFGGKMKNIFAALGAAIAALAIFNFAKGWVDDANESEKAFTKLQAVIKATGGAAGFSAEQMAALSDEMEAMTGIEAEVVQQAQAVIATFRNIRGREFVEATEAAADMAAVLGGDVSSAATMVSKALNDPLQGITALSKAGVTFSDKQKDMIAQFIKTGDVASAQQVILEELRAEYGGTAEALGQTFGGQLTRLQIRLGNAGEELGGAIVTILDSLMPLADGIITMIENVMPAVHEIAHGIVEIGSIILDKLSPVFDWLLDTGIAVWTALEMVITDFADIATAAMLKFQLGIVTTFSVVVHWLTDVIPGVLVWFAENWINIFTDIASGVTTILSNMLTNISEFIDAVMAYLAGEGFDFEFTALTDGFETSIKKLPEIAERVPGELEKALTDKIGIVGERLGQKFGDKFNEKKKLLMDLTVPKERDKIDMTSNAEKVDASDLKQAKEKKEKEEKEKKDKEPKEKKEKEEKKDDSHAAKFEDLQSLSKRIQEAAASTERDKPTKELNETNKQLKEGVQKLATIMQGATTNLVGKLIDVGKNSGINPAKMLLDGLTGLGGLAIGATKPGAKGKMFDALWSDGIDLSGLASAKSNLRHVDPEVVALKQKEHDKVLADNMRAWEETRRAQDAAAYRQAQEALNVQKGIKAASDKTAEKIDTLGTLQ